MSTIVNTLLHVRRSVFKPPSLLLLLPLILVLGGCGSAASAPQPTSTPPRATQPRRLTDQQAVAAAEQFVRAYQRSDRRTMVSLMGRGLRLRSRMASVARMLGAQNQPFQIKVVHAHTFPGPRGGWTRVIVRLEFDHGAVTDRLTVVKTPKGYRITRINRRAPPTS